MKKNHKRNIMILLFFYNNIIRQNIFYSISRYLDEVVIMEARGRPETIPPTFVCPTSLKGVLKRKRFMKSEERKQRKN